MSNPLSPDQWPQLESLLDELLDTPPEHRAARLTEVSGGDPLRRAELERLLNACESASPLIEQPAIERFAALFDDPPLEPSFVIAERYRITRELRRGGMAIVYLAHDLRHRRDVALKVVRSDVAASVASARFLREIEIAAQLRHPHIVPLFDSGRAPAVQHRPDADRSSEAILYYVMPYEAGHSLRDRLRRDGALPVDQAIAIVRDVCDALAYAHQCGIVHRDIKPDNVLLSGKHALVTDFGIARAATEATSVSVSGAGSALVGTPAYMAPEQISGEADVDHRADIYSLGVLAYELLTGRPPFEGQSAQAVLDAHLSQAPAPLATRRAGVNAALDTLVMRCLAKAPSARWQSADDLVRALDALRAPTTPRFSWRSIAAAAAVLVGTVAVSHLPAWREGGGVEDVGAPRLGVAILPVKATSASGDLQWLEGGLENHLAVELASVPGLEVRPAETVAALTRAGWTLDSVSLALAIDYFVRVAPSGGAGDSLVMALELIERGLRTKRVAVLRLAAGTAPTVESLARLSAERFRPMLGSLAREREMEHGATSALALRYRRYADRHRLLAWDRLRDEDYAGADRAIDSASTLLVASERLDPGWHAPPLARAALAEMRAFGAMQRSRGTDHDGARRAFDASIALLDTVLARIPRHAAALGARGRLRWQRLLLGGNARAGGRDAADSARADLEAALALNPSLPRAAADLSDIFATVYIRHDRAVVYGERALRIDPYLEESSQILDRLARSNLELMRDDAAAHWCREGMRRYPLNPSHHTCMLDVMAWGTGSADADSAWRHYRELERLMPRRAGATSLYYMLEVAAVLARSEHVPRDSVERMLARIRQDVATSRAPSPALLALEAGVRYRLGDRARADELVESLARQDPVMAHERARERMLREFVDTARLAR